MKLRLKSIAEFVDFNDQVADIGCDHAYLAIYLIKNQLCQKVIATDINQNALKIAQNNIKKNNLEDKIKTYLSDGLKNVLDNEINTLIIAGMGAHTILHIIKETLNNDIDKFIIQSNNNLRKLRKSLYKNQIYLQKEKVIYENKHYYTIGLYTKKYRKLTIREQLFGIYNINNKRYYAYLKKELDTINQKLKFFNFSKKIIIKLKSLLLKKYL